MQHNPVVLSGIGEPALILEFLAYLLAVDRRHRMGREAEIPERSGKMLAAQATVDEELDGGRTLRR